MFSLDIKTVYFFVGLTTLLMPSLTWFVLKKDQNRPIAIWCIGGLLLGIGLICISFREVIPNWISFFIANLLISLAIALRIQALRIEILRPWRWSWLLIGVIIHMLIFQYIHNELNNNLLRIEYTLLIYTIGFAYITIHSIELSKLPNSRSAIWIGFVHFFNTLAIFILFVLVSTKSIEPNILNANNQSLFVPLFSFLSSIIGSLAYINISVERNIQNYRLNILNKSKKTERKLFDTIALLNRQQSLGQISASFSHELNQPLTVILTNAEILKLKLNKDETEKKDLLDKIISNTLRASNITHKIKNFISPINNSINTIDANQVIKDTIDLLDSNIKKTKTEVCLKLIQSPLLIYADPTHISQVLLNIFRNGIEAMQNSTHRILFIETDRDNFNIFISVRDTGPGINKIDLINIGKQFFTTKSNGLGLGLSISKSILEQYGAKLIISNHQETGAQFTIVFPLQNKFSIQSASKNSV